MFSSASVGSGWSHGFGVKIVGTTEDIRPTTLFRIGSITKTLTAIAVMREEEAGHLDLAATVKTLIPDLALTDANGWSTRRTSVRAAPPGRTWPISRDSPVS